MGSVNRPFHDYLSLCSNCSNCGDGQFALNAREARLAFSAVNGAGFVEYSTVLLHCFFTASEK